MWQAAPISNQVYHESYTCTSVRRHPTLAHFLTQSNGGYVAIFSSNSPFKLNKHKRFEGHQVTGFKVGFDVSPDGQYVLSGSADGLLYCYTYQSAAVARKLRIASSAVTEVACHPVLESLVAMGTWDGTISLWQWIKSEFTFNWVIFITSLRIHYSALSLGSLKRGFFGMVRRMMRSGERYNSINSRYSDSSSSRSPSCRAKKISCKSVNINKC